MMNAPPKLIASQTGPAVAHCSRWTRARSLFTLLGTLPGTLPGTLLGTLLGLTILSACAGSQDHLQTELYPETQQPYFKTCAARLGGTYKERELQRHLVVDIYQEPAPDEGPMTDECITRE